MKKAERQKVFDKYGGRCAYCGCELTKSWHVDHLLPVKRKKKVVEGCYIETLSGKHTWIPRHFINDGYDFPERDVIENKVPACGSCNIQKHSQSVEVFREQIASFITSLNKYHTIYKFAKRYGLVEETGKPVIFYFETIKN